MKIGIAHERREYMNKEESNTAKRPKIYDTPKLKVYGGITQLTANGSQMGMENGGKGMDVNCPDMC